MLMMALTTTMVSAADTTADTAKVTIQNDSNTTAVSISGVAFSLYKVFDLKVVDADEEEGTSETINYTVAEAFEGFFDVELAGEDVSSDDDDLSAYTQAALDYVNANKVFSDDGDITYNTMSTLVDDLRDYIIENSIEPQTTTGTTASNANGVETITSEEVPYGYYLILDADGTTTNGGVVPTGSLVTVPGRATDGTLSADVTVVMKGSIPEMNKEVWHNDIDSVSGDVSPTYGTSGAWDTVSDYQINDVIEYRITATIPSDLRGYSSETYEYTITDTLSAGIDIVEGSVKIYTSPTLSSESEVAGGYHKVTYGTGDDDFTFIIDFDMYGIVNDPALDGIEEFYIYYKAVVSEDAVIAENYESNTATLEYSNNPYDSTSKGKIDSTVYTYTFDLDILKTSGDGVTPLAGAKFALYEISGEGSSQTITQIYLELDTNIADTDTAQTYYPINATASNSAGIITTNNSGEFDIFGLDDETTYMLKEIEAPTGYNAIDPITFVIHADYDTSGGGVPVLTIRTTGTDFSTDGSGLFGTIINTSSQLLPSTGGIGTTVFMVIGGGLMVSALVLLVVKRRRTVK